MEINNKTIILTGASAGIGKEILTCLVRYENVRIIAVARKIEDITAIENKVFPFSADVSTQEGVDSVFEFAQHIYGNTDIFIANAGFGYLEKLDKPDWKHIQDIFSLNVFSTIYSLEKLVAEQGGRKKAFVSVISGAALASLPGYSLYCSTKAALHQFMETYRYEKTEDLQITAVYPVATRTAFFDKAANKDKTPLPFPRQDAKTVVEKIVRGIEKGKKKVYPSILFSLGYPIGRAFPIFLKLYSLGEKKRVKSYIHI
ncbi:MAG: SDR family NAD(P)-dependent oxidoreductase [Odoribacter sp.]|nr:SDR family NAD(P)-dependent oxidoreductase [Odoribacter sp.]